jgi:hypothetical protein
MDNSGQISLLEMKKHSVYLQFINDLSSKQLYLNDPETLEHVQTYIHQY